MIVDHMFFLGHIHTSLIYIDINIVIYIILIFNDIYIYISLSLSSSLSSSSSLSPLISHQIIHLWFVKPMAKSLEAGQACEPYQCPGGNGVFGWFKL